MPLQSFSHTLIEQSKCVHPGAHTHVWFTQEPPGKQSFGHDATEQSAPVKPSANPEFTLQVHAPSAVLTRPDAVVLIERPDELAKEFALGRMTDPATGETYHSAAKANSKSDPNRSLRSLQALIVSYNANKIPHAAT